MHLVTIILTIFLLISLSFYLVPSMDIQHEIVTDQTTMIDESYDQDTTTMLPQENNLFCTLNSSIQEQNFQQNKCLKMIAENIQNKSYTKNDLDNENVFLCKNLECKNNFLQKYKILIENPFALKNHYSTNSNTLINFDDDLYLNQGVTTEEDFELIHAIRDKEKQLIQVKNRNLYMSDILSNVDFCCLNQLQKRTILNFFFNISFYLDLINKPFKSFNNEVIYRVGDVILLLQLLPSRNETYDIKTTNIFIPNRINLETLVKKIQNVKIIQDYVKNKQLKSCLRFLSTSDFFEMFVFPKDLQKLEEIELNFVNQANIFAYFKNFDRNMLEDNKFFKFYIIKLSNFIHSLHHFCHLSNINPKISYVNISKKIAFDYIYNNNKVLNLTHIFPYRDYLKPFIFNHCIPNLQKSEQNIFYIFISLSQDEPVLIANDENLQVGIFAFNISFFYTTAIMDQKKYEEFFYKSVLFLKKMKISPYWFDGIVYLYYDLTNYF